MRSPVALLRLGEQGLDAAVTANLLDGPGQPWQAQDQGYGPYHEESDWHAEAELKKSPTDPYPEILFVHRTSSEPVHNKVYLRPWQGR
jgi:hypothetical protein